MKKWKTVDIAYVGLFAVIMAVCSWISIPTTVPFTMQTFGVFCTLGILNGRRGTFAILVYILLGAVGIPVFAGFAGGFGVLFGMTGGYILGFLLSGVVYWIVTKHLGDGIKAMIFGMVLGLVICYTFGTAWFMYVYAGSVGAIGLGTALGWCVLPFIIPDIIKLVLAITLTKRVKKHITI